MKILLTAFEPFGGESTNPSQELLKALPDKLHNAAIIKLTLPVTFTDSAVLVQEALAAHQPDMVLSIGQAGGRATLSLEQVAINLNEASIPDNNDFQPKDQPIDPSGPDGLFTTLPIKKMAQASHHHGVPAYISYTAGTYVCNHVMYSTLRWLQLNSPSTKAGFLHIPFTPDQVLSKTAQPSMTLECMSAGLIAMLEACIIPYETFESFTAGATQ